MDDDSSAALPFEGGQLIRRQWHQGAWYFSVVDVVGLLTDSPEPRVYWGVLKGRLEAEGAGQLFTNCKRLRMRALDGKQRETDAADVETMLRIVQSIPSPKAEPIKQWLAEAGAEKLEELAQSDILAAMSPEQRAIFLRGQMKDRNITLAEAAQASGVLDGRDFAYFQDAGYMGLYDGERRRDIAARKGLKRGQDILDWMGPDELAANIFRASLANQGIRNAPPEEQTKAGANATHFKVGQIVRGAIEAAGGAMPETLPTPAQSIKELERLEQKRLEGERQPSLFPDDMPADD